MDFPTLNPTTVATEPEVTFQPEFLEDASPESDSYREICDVLRRSQLDSGFSSKWQPAKVQVIRNKSLAADYDEKRQDFLIRGRKESELAEQWGFVVENNTATLELVCSIGFQAKDSEYNALGYNRMGVYTCKYSDVCLQHALIKHSGSPIMRMVICKYVAGRPTKAIPRVASASEFIEPTQGFDSHESVIPPGPSDSLQNQFDRSQVYLYEINKLLQPAHHPRQLLPYALVSYTVDGLYIPAIDAEATTAEKLSTNPRLQQIIHQINTKETSAAGGGSDSAGGSNAGSPSPAPTGGGLLMTVPPTLSPAAALGSPTGDTATILVAANGSAGSPSPGLDLASDLAAAGGDWQQAQNAAAAVMNAAAKKVLDGGGAGGRITVIASSAASAFLPSAGPCTSVAQIGGFLQPGGQLVVSGGHNGLLPSPQSHGAAAGIMHLAKSLPVGSAAGYLPAAAAGNGLIGLSRSSPVGAGAGGARPLTPDHSQLNGYLAGMTGTSRGYSFGTAPGSTLSAMGMPPTLYAANATSLPGATSIYASQPSFLLPAASNPYMTAAAFAGHKLTAPAAATSQFFPGSSLGGAGTTGFMAAPGGLLGATAFSAGQQPAYMAGTGAGGLLLAPMPTLKRSLAAAAAGADPYGLADKRAKYC